MDPLDAIDESKHKFLIRFEDGVIKVDTLDNKVPAMNGAILVAFGSDWSHEKVKNHFKAHGYLTIEGWRKTGQRLRKMYCLLDGETVIETDYIDDIRYHGTNQSIW